MEVTGNSVHLSKYVSISRLILPHVALTPLDIKVDKLCCYGFTIVFCTNIGTYQADGLHRFVKEGERRVAKIICKSTGTQAGASKISLLTVGAQAVLDVYLCLIHLVAGILIGIAN